MTTVFGPASDKVQGKAGPASFFAFSFKDKVIVSVYEGSGVGAKWYWVTGKQGSRYGTPMLLSCDNEVKDFWADFCNEFMDAVNIKEEPAPKIKR